jgi:hypothetical protein
LAGLGTGLQAHFTWNMDHHCWSMACKLSEWHTFQIIDLQGYPVDIWKKAAEIIKEHTQLAGAFVAVVTPPEEADFAWPEEEEGQEGAAGTSAETDDDAEDSPIPPPPAEEGEPEEDATPEVRHPWTAAAPFCFIAATLATLLHKQHETPNSCMVGVPCLVGIPCMVRRRSVCRLLGDHTL